MADTEFQQLAKTDRNPAQETRYQELLKTQGGSAGGISLNDVGGSAVDFAKGLNASEDEAFNQYVMSLRAQAKPLDIFTSLEQNAGLPEMRKTATTLRGQVGSIEDLLSQVEGDVSATTRDSLVTEAQRRGMVSAKKEPWIERLNKLATSLGRVEQGISAAGADISQRTGLVLQGQQQELEPYKMKIQVMADRSARLMTGFTSDREANLTILMDKLQRERQLDDREWQEASDLAQSKLEFDQQKELLASKLETQIVERGGRKVLLNMQTGAVVADLGATGGGGGVPANLGSYYGTTTTTNPQSSGSSITDLWNVG